MHVSNILRLSTKATSACWPRPSRNSSRRKDQVDLDNAVVWVPDSKTPNRVAEVPLTPLAVQPFRDQLRFSGPGDWLFPSDKNQSGH